MPEGPPDYGRAAERALILGSLICLLAAILAFATGGPVSLRSGSIRTHTDAVWVLGTLAVVLFTAAFLVSDERRPRD